MRKFWVTYVHRDLVGERTYDRVVHSVPPGLPDLGIVRQELKRAIHIEHHPEDKPLDSQSVLDRYSIINFWEIN